MELDHDGLAGVASIVFRINLIDHRNVSDSHGLAFTLWTFQECSMCMLVLKCNSNCLGCELSLILSVSHKHTTLMMEQQGILASVWVSHHLWQLLLSLTTLSAQEVISELDYHHQPYSAVRNTHRVHMG